MCKRMFISPDATRWLSKTIMKHCSKITVLFVVMLTIGISISFAGCENITGGGDDKKDDTPTPVPAPSQTTLLNTTVALSLNSQTDAGTTYGESVYFTPTVGKVINISASGPSNMDIDLHAYFPNGASAGSAAGVTHGSETMNPFVATVAGRYTLSVVDGTRLGGSVSVLVTEK